VSSPDVLRAQLTGPGGPFELRVEDVRGVPLPVFAHRHTALRDWLVESSGYADREFLVQGERRLTFAQHVEAVAAVADLLAREYGVGAGDRVAILAANSPDWVVTFWAGVALGAVLVAGNAWWTAREAGYSLTRVHPSVVVADEKRAAVLAGLDLPVLPTAEVARTIDEGPRVALPDVARPDEDDPAVVMFTSGTTGHPKGAVHSHRNLLAVIEYHRYIDAMAAVLGLSTARPRRYLLGLPLFHIATLHNLVLPRMTTGDTVVLDAGRFDADRVLRLVEREKITSWAVVPTMAHRIVSHPDLDRYDLSSLVGLSITSAPSAPALKERVQAVVPNAAIADSYGLTEVSTAATVATPLDLAAHPTSVGRAIPSVEISIRGAAGEQLPDGTEGEIWLRSQFTMLGYWDDPMATAAMIAPDGWLRTGDLGTLRDGYLFLATRRADLILRGGENVYPAEVEAVLDEHPAVVECAVFAVDDPDLGQAVAAVVVGDGLDVDALRVFAAERLAYYKVPAHWRLTSEPLLRTATGKVVRRALAL
jgi:Acyl-CoA synthetases (AMP-forming)/AMP-acid ligases II